MQPERIVNYDFVELFLAQMYNRRVMIIDRLAGLFVAASLEGTTPGRRYHFATEATINEFRAVTKILEGEIPIELKAQIVRKRKN